MSLVDKLKSKIGQILESRPISIAYLYDSYAAGNAMPLSDVDAALVAETKLEPHR